MAPEIFKKTGHGKPVDLWALGVITYFLLCGYTPFDRDSDLEEMQAILNADYSFTPTEYWRGVTDSAKDFIRRCLTIDPAKRMTAHEALQHPFVAGWARGGPNDGDKGQNLLPTVKKNFNARRTLHAAIDTVRAINKLREGQFMNGARSNEPGRKIAAKNGGDSGLATPSVRGKGDSGISISGGTSQGDSGYGTGGSSREATDGDVTMGEAPPMPVPASLRPGSEANRVVETSKGLWNGTGLAGRR
jgi:serine/threonine protein kinase